MKAKKYLIKALIGYCSSSSGEIILGWYAWSMETKYFIPVILPILNMCQTTLLSNLKNNIFFCKQIKNPGGIQGKKIPWKADKTAFDKWCNGQTGVPFVDANMRELKATGWMSNRGRQNVARYVLLSYF